MAPSISVDFNSGGDNMAFHFNDNADLVNPAKWNVAQFYDNANRNDRQCRDSQPGGRL